uniref:Secreted protein n=1 Tax=Cacopsylla melanoneura TaxID=428564 RepID=A0A8D8ZCW2_9HEMI
MKHSFCALLLLVLSLCFLSSLSSLFHHFLPVYFPFSLFSFYCLFFSLVCPHFPHYSLFFLISSFPQSSSSQYLVTIMSCNIITGLELIVNPSMQLLVIGCDNDKIQLVNKIMRILCGAHNCFTGFVSITAFPSACIARYL